MRVLGEAYLVSADHVHEDYRFTDTIVDVREHNWDGKSSYSAIHPKLGCGKDRSTPEFAILHLFRDHACTSIRSTRAIDRAVSLCEEMVASGTAEGDYTTIAEEVSDRLGLPLLRVLDAWAAVSDRM